MSAVIYSADLGGYDEAWPIALQGPDVEVRRVASPGPAQVRSRWHKWHPRPGAAEWSIWVDSSIEVHSPDFVAQVVEATGDADLGVFRHPAHSDIWTELAAVEALPSCGRHGHRKMVENLAATAPSMPEVVALGVIVRRAHQTDVLDDLVYSTGVRWNASCIRDQIVFPFVAQALDVHPTVIDPPGGDLWANDWFTVHPHRGAP